MIHDKSYRKAVLQHCATYPRSCTMLYDNSHDIFRLISKNKSYENCTIIGLIVQLSHDYRTIIVYTYEASYNHCTTVERKCTYFVRHCTIIFFLYNAEDIHPKIYTQEHHGRCFDTSTEIKADSSP